MSAGGSGACDGGGHVAVSVRRWGVAVASNTDTGAFFNNNYYFFDNYNSGVDLYRGWGLQGW